MLCFNASIRSTTFCSARSWLVSGARNSSGAAESFPLKETLEGPKRYHPPIRSGTNMAGHQDARYIPPRREGDRSPRSSRWWLVLPAIIIIAVTLAALMLLHRRGETGSSRSDKMNSSTTSIGANGEKPFK